jgi:hypothetical protein
MNKMFWIVFNVLKNIMRHAIIKFLFSQLELTGVV